MVLPRTGTTTIRPLVLDKLVNEKFCKHLYHDELSVPTKIVTTPPAGGRIYKLAVAIQYHFVIFVLIPVRCRLHFVFI